MIVKNQETIDRTVIRLRTILETDDDISDDEMESIQMALDALIPISTGKVEVAYPSRTS